MDVAVLLSAAGEWGCGEVHDEFNKIANPKLNRDTGGGGGGESVVCRDNLVVSK